MSGRDGGRGITRGNGKKDRKEGELSKFTPILLLLLEGTFKHRDIVSLILMLRD
jgi:hypothetical protein